MDSSLMRQAMRSGARDFLEKPVSTQELRDSVHSVLAQEEQKQLSRWADAPEIRARGTVITVAGAKGGIGKTTLATNLAIALREITGQEIALVDGDRSEEHTSELQSLMRISYAVFCLKK